MGVVGLTAGPEAGGKNWPERPVDDFPPALKLLKGAGGAGGAGGRAAEVPGGGGGAEAPGARNPPTVGGSPGGGGGGNVPFFFPTAMGLRSLSFPGSPPAARRADEKKEINSKNRIALKIYLMSKEYKLIIISFTTPLLDIRSTTLIL